MTSIGAYALAPVRQLSTLERRAHWRIPYEQLRAHVPDELPLDRFDGDARLGITPFRLTGLQLVATPAVRAAMEMGEADGRTVFASRRLGEPRTFGASYTPTGPVAEAQPGTLEHFLTERYCLYAVGGDGVHRSEIHHAPWPLQPAEAEILTNTMPPSGLELAGEPLLHFSARQDVLVWPLETLG